MADVDGTVDYPEARGGAARPDLALRNWSPTAAEMHNPCTTTRSTSKRNDDVVRSLL